jgi:hypothetical protein
MRKHLSPGVVLGAIAVVLAMSASAVAGTLITSAKIKDGSIANRDIKKGRGLAERVPAQRPVQAALRHRRAEPDGQGRHGEGRGRQ